MNEELATRASVAKMAAVNLKQNDRHACPNFTLDIGLRILRFDFSAVVRFHMNQFRV